MPGPSSAAGPGTSGLPAAGATPPTATPAPPAPPSFDQQIRQQFGMDPATLRSMATLGYQQYQRQSQPQPAPNANPATPAQPKNPFGLPDFDRRYLSFVTNGPNGLEPIPGAPPDAVYKVQEYREKLLDAQYRFFENPRQFLQDMIREEAKSQAAEVYQERFTGHQAQTAAQRIVEENSSWLFEHDNGQARMQFNPATGREERMLSPWGRYYSQCLQQANSAGVTDPTMQHQWAQSMVENAALRQRLQANGAPAAGQAAAQQFLNGAAGQPTSPPPVAAPTPPAPSYREAVNPDLAGTMSRNFAAHGLTDEVVRQQILSGR